MRVLEPLAKLQTLHLQELPDLSSADIASLAKLSALQELHLALGKPNSRVNVDVPSATKQLQQHLPSARVWLRANDHRSFSERLRTIGATD